jgi:cytoskeletal protein RodZ
MVVDEASEAELPLDGVGGRLLRAREAGGMTRAQLAAITKIPERHLAAIEAGNFAALPAKTYAVGFSRSYARAVGIDERQVADQVRAELAEQEADAPRGAAAPSFEPSDPARTPSSRTAWLSVLAAVILILAGLAWWRGMFAPGGELPSILPEETSSAAASQTPAATVQTPSGPVVFTALEPQVWVKFTDAAGNQLFQSELRQGESYTVPADLAEVRLTTARPNALSISIGGQPVAKLSEVQQIMRNVPVTATALLARETKAAAPSPGPSAASGGGRPHDSQLPRARIERRPPAAAGAEPSVAPIEPAPTPAASPTTAASANPSNPTADR